MKKIYIILLSIIGVISSCTKHEDIIDTSLQPGSILCSDGSIVHPSLFSPSEKEAIGVVFWCNDGNNPNIKETAYAVSLEDLEENPLIDTDEDIANVSEDENSFDGAANTASAHESHRQQRNTILPYLHPKLCESFDLQKAGFFPVRS